MGSDVETGDQWKEVDDFKWLRNEASPNWSVLDSAHRVQESTWRDVKGVASAEIVENVLNMVGVAKPT